MRRTVAVVLGLLLLAAAVAALSFATVDPNTYKALIEQRASQALGRTVRIGGPIELSRSLTPTVVFHDLSIAGAEPDSTAVSAARVELAVVLTSLLFGPVHLPRVAIETALLDLPFGPLPAVGAAPVPRIDQVTFSNLTVRWRRHDGDALAGVIEQATVLPAADATTLAVDGTVGAVPLQLKGTTGPLAALVGGAADWPLKVDATVGDGRLTLAGKLGLGDRPAFALDAKADLPASAAIADALALPALPLQATARLDGDAAGVTVGGLALTVGHTDVQGDLAWQHGARGKLSGKLKAKRIDLAELEVTADGVAAPGDVVPNLPMLTPAQVPFDVDLAIAAGRLDLPAGVAITDLVAVASGSAQGLDLILTQSGLGGGSVQAHYDVNTDGASDAIGLKVAAKGIDLGSVFGDPGGGNRLPEDVTVALDLSGQGTDLHAFLGSASGPLALRTGAAVLNETFVNLLGRSLFTAIIPHWRPSQGAQIICSVLDFEAKHGKARTSAFVIDGEHVVVGGGGAIELASGKLDFMLLPTPKNATLAPFVTPVHLAGTVLAPQVVGDASDILEGAGHLLLGIVDPLSLATPILHRDRSGDAPCRDPAAFDGQPGPIGRAGHLAVEAVEDVGHGIGAAVEGLGAGAAKLLHDITGR